MLFTAELWYWWILRKGGLLSSVVYPLLITPGSKEQLPGSQQWTLLKPVVSKTKSIGMKVGENCEEERGWAWVVGR